MPSVYRINGDSNATGTNVTGLNYVAGGYTFAFWAKGPNANGGGDIIRQSSTANTARDGYIITFGSAELQARHLTATTATTYNAVSNNRHHQRIWQHFAITYDGSVVRGYVNGVLVGRTAAANVPTANAACTTTLAPSPAINSVFAGNLFDLQIILGASVPEQNIRKLMDPTVVNPNLKGRYFGLGFVGVGAGGILVDESGNGNNLTVPVAPGRLDIGEEPPIRPTFA